MDIACRSFGIPSPKEGDVKGNTVTKAFEGGNIEAVNEYVMRDVEATHQLFEKLKQYIIYNHNTLCLKNILSNLDILTIYHIKNILCLCN